jgi:hypothetical protein
MENRAVLRNDVARLLKREQAAGSACTLAAEPDRRVVSSASCGSQPGLFVFMIFVKPEVCKPQLPSLAK